MRTIKRQPQIAVLKSCLLVALYALLLITAQQSALSHAAWHAGAQTPPHHDGQGPAPDNSLCDLHHACTHVLGGAQGAPPLWPVGSHTHVLTAAPALPGGAARFLGPLSRGPPPHS